MTQVVINGNNTLLVLKGQSSSCSSPPWFGLMRCFICKAVRCRWTVTGLMVIITLFICICFYVSLSVSFIPLKTDSEWDVVMKCLTMHLLFPHDVVQLGWDWIKAGSGFTQTRPDHRTAPADRPKTNTADKHILRPKPTGFGLLLPLKDEEK